MESNFTFYIFCLIAIVVAFVVIKKVTSCLVKSILMLIIVAAMAYLFYHNFYVQ